jgi:putative colanic acid biosynthesis UDP-glucose lipid carrier transferase
MRNIIKSLRSREKNKSTIIILGSGNVANEVYNEIIRNINNGYQFMGFFDDRPESDFVLDRKYYRGTLTDVVNFLKENNVDEIFCALPAGEDRKAIPVLNYAENNLIRFYFIPDFKRFLTKKVKLQFIDNIPIVFIRSEPLESYSNRLFKRVFDVFAAFLFLITVFPWLLIIISVAIKLSSRGPVFFKQKRTGKNGENFICIKFRSMNLNKEANERPATKNDARVTKVGAFLRKTNLDETPQFLNVLMGDMSIVGPRPHMLKQTEEYSHLIDKYMLRHLAKPGITGLAQITGCRGETRNVQEMEKRIQRDVWYLENWTFWIDIKIIFQTVVLMIKGDENAY